MDQLFSVCGIQVPFSQIVDYKIVQKDFIFRPSFIELPLFSMQRILSPTPYKFDKMLPYASVISKNEYKQALNGENDPKSLSQTVINNIPSGIIGLLSRGNVLSDLASGITSGLIDSVSNKIDLGGKDTLYCLSISGRPFTTKLKDVPSILSHKNGAVSEIDKKNPIHRLLDKNINPFISAVDALYIQTPTGSNLFYGNGIQLDDVKAAYMFLCQNIPISSQSGYTFNPYPGR